MGAGYFDGVNTPYAGAAYVFAQSGGVWAQEAKLVANDGEVGDTIDGDQKPFASPIPIPSRQPKE